MYRAVGRFIVLFVLTLSLIMASQESVVVEGRTCESQSHGFKGKCLSDHNCGLVCKNEGFTNGKCRGLRQRCFCTKNC